MAKKGNVSWDQALKREAQKETNHLLEMSEKTPKSIIALIT